MLDRLLAAKELFPELITDVMIADYHQVVKLALMVKGITQKAILRDYGQFKRRVPLKIMDQIIPYLEQCRNLENKYVKHVDQYCKRIEIRPFLQQ